MKLVLLGPPGSGKGTQAEKLSKEFNILKISTGDILRDAVHSNTELGRRVKEYLLKGRLVPDEIILDLMSQKLGNLKGFILDGFPRTLPQAIGLEKRTDIDFVVAFVLPNTTVISRLSKRRVCIKCGAVYSLDANPPLRKNICDRCGSKLRIRDDDKKSTIRKRFLVYKRETKPLEDFYKKKKILKYLDGNGSADEVYRRLKKLISNKV